MKKYLMILVAVVGFGVNAYADCNTATCKIQGTDNRTVEAYSTDNGDGTVTVSFSNDSEKYVNVRYSCGGQDRSKLVPPQSSASDTFKKSSPGASQCITIQGAQCQK